MFPGFSIHRWIHSCLTPTLIQRWNKIRWKTYLYIGQHGLGQSCYSVLEGRLACSESGECEKTGKMLHIFLCFLNLNTSSMEHPYLSSDDSQEEVGTSEVTEMEVFVYQKSMKGTPLKNSQLKMPIKLSTGHKFSNTPQSPLIPGPGHWSPSPQQSCQGNLQAKRRWEL